jgi:genome maintenance exonuclease 1
MYQKQYVLDLERYPAAEFPRVVIDGKRHYECDGIALPSVTTILSELEDEEYLKAWKERTSDEDQERARRRATTHGTAVHEIVERFVAGHPDALASMSPLIATVARPMLAEVCKVHTIHGSEVPIASKQLGYGGTIDLWGKIVDERKNIHYSVIDLKTGRYATFDGKVSERYAIQVTLYALALEEMYNLAVEKGRVILSTTYDGLHVYTFDTADYRERAINIVKEYHERHRKD